MKLRKKLATTAFGAAAATAVLVGTANPASAAGYSTYSISTSNYCSSAKFESYGEHLKVWDNCRDGYGVAVVYWWMYWPGDDAMSKRVTLEIDYNHDGVGTYKDFDWEVPEGEVVKFQACVSTGTTLKYCSPVRSATA